jgi:hypothetical protein
MRNPLIVRLLPVVALMAAVSAAQDRAPEVLASRAARPVAPSSGDGALPRPRVLFTAEGDDNVATLALHPDADGDGVPDVVVGWDIFKTGDNLAVLSGAGFDDGRPVWSLETQDGISGGYFWDLDQATAFPDITGDGLSELLTGTAGGGRAATLYDGADGTVLQSFDTYLGPATGWVYAVAALPDVNRNGTPDLALCTGSDDNAVYVVDGGLVGSHHDEIWRFQGADAFFTLAVVPDIDGDGLPDVVAGSGDNADDVWALSAADGGILWKHDAGASVHHLRAYPDANGDGRDEIVVGSWSGPAGLRLLNGANGSAVWTSGVPGTFVMRVIPLDDVDGDGRDDLAVASWADSAIVVSGLDGSLIWATPAGGDVWAIDRVDDVTADGIDDVAFGSFNGFAYLADGTDGTLLWEHSANGHKVLRLIGSTDLDADGRPEVVAGAQQLSSTTEPLLFVLDADSGLASGPELRRSGSTAPGGTLIVELGHAAPGDLAWWLLGVEPALLPVGAKGWLGLDPSAPLLTLFALPVPGGGFQLLSGTIPGDPGLVGIVLYLQAFVLAPSPPLVGASANRLGFEIGP